MTTSSKPLYAIMRMARLKTTAEVRASAYHIERLQATPNARPGVHNPWVAGGPDLWGRAKKVWGKIPGIRKDNVRGIEVMMSATGEAFKGPNGIDIDAWAKDSTKWLQDEFKGAVILGVSLHLDEQVPHMHALIIPTDRKPDGTPMLNAKKYVGNKVAMIARQTSYHKAVAHHGLIRGIEGSTATHTTIAQYYAMLNGVAQLKLTRPVVQPPPMILSASARLAWADAQTKRIVSDMSPEIRNLKALAIQGAVSEKQNRELKQANSDLRKQLSEAKRKEAASRLRELPLEVVAQALGCHKTPKVVAKDKHLWESPAGKISISGTKFYNQESGAGGGGAFDLVMHINDCDYKTALAWLRDEFDPGAAVQAAVEAARIKAEAEVAEAAKTPPAPFQAPVHVEASWPRVREYLVGVRALAEALVDKLRNAGWLGADARNNAYFVKQEGNRITSVELKGTGRSQFTGSRGRSKDGVFIVQGGTEKLAVCEAPIDAISYVQLHPQATAIATGGTGKWSAAIEFLYRHRAKYKAVVCASDNNPAGAEMAENLSLPHEPPPNGIEDWNDAVRALRDDPTALQPKGGNTAKPAVRAPEAPRLARTEAGNDEPSPF